MASIMNSPVEIPRWKRRLDVVLILLAMPAILPLAVLIAVVIRVVSSGPVLFRQERVGYLGRSFMCFKFRTMYVGTETAVHRGHLHQLIHSDAPMVKLDSRGDSRIIPFGLLLRSSGLDEPGGAAAVPGLRMRKLCALAKGTIQHAARADRVVAGQRQEPDDVHRDDAAGHQLRAEQYPLAGFGNHN